MNKKKWYDYLWIFSSIYLLLGFVNILFAWLGLICFITPLAISIIKGNKGYCNRYCGRGQLFSMLGGRFGLMLWNTYLFFADVKNLKQIITLFWTFKVPWNWAYHGTLFSSGVAQFAFGFYSIMLTSTLLGLLTMVLFKPRSWCIYCPMGTMTQMICKIKNPTKNNKN